MGIFDIFKKRKQNKEIGDASTQSLAINDADKGLEVVLESLPTTFDETQGHLVEITEPSVLARIDAVIPAATVVHGLTLQKPWEVQEKSYIRLF